MRDRFPSDPRRFLGAYGVLSLASVGAGCWIAAAHGVPAGVWARNLAAWAIGLVIAALVAGTAGRRVAAGIILAAVAGLLATLLSLGLSGVHRWLQVGPVQLNVAEIILPGAVVALAALGQGSRWPWLAAAAVGAVLVAQPDASQAMAFGAAIIAMLLLSSLPRAFRWSGVAIAAIAMIAVWFRPDPLAPVPEVEEIFQLAWASSPLTAILAGAALGMTALTPAFAGPNGDAAFRGASLAMVVYFVMSALGPALGAFPAPLVGIGVSPILGSWLGVGLLAALAAGRLTSSPAP
jgi:cell division protein FtsW (lipid II flippase)